jgi:hypothetical protein
MLTDTEDKRLGAIEKAGIEVREDTAIRSNEISQGLLSVEHPDGKRRGKGYLAVPPSFFYAGGESYF